MLLHGCTPAYLSVDHGDRDPIVTPEQTALGSELAKLPHDGLKGVGVEQLVTLGRLLQPVDEPGAGDPVGVELVSGYRTEQLLLSVGHETWQRNKVGFLFGGIRWIFFIIHSP